MLPLESVPNFSEGRDRGTIDAIGRALSEHARLLDVHADADHNRSVFTVVGEEAALVDALVAGVAAARERIGRELELPVFLYAESADGRGLAFFRRGGPEELQRRLAAGEVVPDFGPHRLDPAAGGAIVGARRPLVAFNVNLRGASLDVAREIASLVRERGGGFPGVRALGLDLPRAGLVQVSMNVEDYEAAALHEIVERVAAEAEARGAEVAGSELVGLMPAGAAVAAARAILRIEGFDASRLVELRLLES